jgi:hypothetical protein
MLWAASDMYCADFPSPSQGDRTRPILC